MRKPGPVAIVHYCHDGVEFNYTDETGTTMAERLSDAHSLIAAAGDLIVGSGPQHDQRLPVGTDGQVLTADSGAAAGIGWADPTGGGGGGSSLEYLTVTVTQADIAALIGVGVPVTTLQPGDWVIAADLYPTTPWPEATFYARWYLGEAEDTFSPQVQYPLAITGQYGSEYGINGDLEASFNADTTAYALRVTARNIYEVVIRGFDRPTEVVTADAAPTLPLVVVAGVNDRFKISGTAYTVAPGTYTTALGLAVAMGTATGGAGYVGSASAGKCVLTLDPSSTAFTIDADSGVSPHNILGSTGFTSGQQSVLTPVQLPSSAGVIKASLLIRRSS